MISGVLCSREVERYSCCHHPPVGDVLLAPKETRYSSLLCHSFSPGHGREEPSSPARRWEHEVTRLRRGVERKFQNSKPQGLEKWDDVRHGAIARPPRNGKTLAAGQKVDMQKVCQKALSPRSRLCYAFSCCEKSPGGASWKPANGIGRRKTTSSART